MWRFLEAKIPKEVKHSFLRIWVLSKKLEIYERENTSEKRVLSGIKMTLSIRSERLEGLGVLGLLCEQFKGCMCSRSQFSHCSVSEEPTARRRGRASEELVADLEKLFWSYSTELAWGGDGERRRDRDGGLGAIEPQCFGDRRAENICLTFQGLNQAPNICSPKMGK